MESVDIFNRKLIDWDAGNPFPHVDPPRGWKPPFIVDAETYLRWFEILFKSSIGQGYKISFIVGNPGAGKSHFMCHLDYLFNVTGAFRGVYSTFSAGQSKITSKALWTDFFLNNDVTNRLKDLLPATSVESHDFRSLKVKENIIDYIKGTLRIDALNEDEIQAMAAGVSDLLATKRAGMCMILDNIDEYFRYLIMLHEPSENVTESEKSQREIDELQAFLGTLRNTCRDMPNFLLLVACTTPVYSRYIQAHAAVVDRTLAGRIEYQSDYIKELSRSQAFELVHKYLDWWSKNNGVNLPFEEECSVKNDEGRTVSIYPFSKSAIEEIYEVTGQFARDIKTICNECINEMKFAQKSWIVKDEYLAHAIDEAHNKRPQIIPPEKLEDFHARRTKWLNGKMKLLMERLEPVARSKYSFGIDEEKLIDVLKMYVTHLGITTDNAPSIENEDNLQWIDPHTLRIWKYKGDKRILVSHIFSNDQPLGNTYYKHIEWRNISDATSYIDAHIATHILFVTRWCGGFSVATRQYWHKTSWYAPIMETISLDKDIFKIIAAVEEGKTDTKDLVEHTDQYYLKLKDTLDRLVSRSKPDYKPPPKEKRLDSRG